MDNDQKFKSIGDRLNEELIACFYDVSGLANALREDGGASVGTYLGEVVETLCNLGDERLNCIVRGLQGYLGEIRIQTEGLLNGVKPKVVAVAFKPSKLLIETLCNKVIEPGSFFVFEEAGEKTD